MKRSFLSLAVAAVVLSGCLRIPRHSDTQPTLIRTPVPRS
ncbi:lipoprotein, partial [Pseudomonas aeruginosa]